MPVDRPPATNPAGIVVGLIRNFTERYPEGMLRVTLLGDPTRALGSLAEPECRRIIAALDLAEELGVPLEWFALSAGAKIAMDSGTENMDWIAAVLRRIIEFTQAGGEINVVVAGINVGAQPYWNAEATMLMHTRGILVMTPESAMVLTGKQALDYSGGVSAEDNFGIGGYERIMGPNGQAQYWAPDLAGACRILLAYYEHAYVAPGERFPRRARTTRSRRPRRRRRAARARRARTSRASATSSPTRANPGRKKPFDIRSVMRRRDRRGPSAARALGGDARRRDRRRLGRPPRRLARRDDRHRVARRCLGTASSPPTAPSSGRRARCSRARRRRSRARSTRPAGAGRLVVLANLAGFDGSPESMREWQLEFGAEIGRAVVNFDGPIVFCVVSRYHGGAFVVFSQRLNENLEAVALEGAHASVIGGAPAAAVVFARDVEQARPARRAHRRARRADRAPPKEPSASACAPSARSCGTTVLSEKRGEFATEVRPRAQRRASGADGLGEPHHRARVAAALP